MKIAITLERAEFETIAEVLAEYMNMSLSERVEGALKAGGDKVTLDMSESDLEYLLDAMCDADDVMERERIRYKVMWQGRVEGGVNDEGFVTLRLRGKDAMNLYAFLAYEGDMAVQGGINTGDLEWEKQGALGEGLAQEVLDQGAGNEPYLKRNMRRAAKMFEREYVRPKGVLYSLKVMDMSEEEICVEILYASKNDEATRGWYANAERGCKDLAYSVYSIIEGAASEVKEGLERAHTYLPASVARAVFRAEGTELDEMNKVINKHPKLKAVVDERISSLQQEERWKREREEAI